jgi:hypothetical protein
MKHGITVDQELYDRLEALRAKFALRSVAATVDHLAALAEGKKQAVVVR